MPAPVSPVRVALRSPDLMRNQEKILRGLLLTSSSVPPLVARDPMEKRCTTCHNMKHSDHFTGDFKTCCECLEKRKHKRKRSHGANESFDFAGEKVELTSTLATSATSGGESSETSFDTIGSEKVCCACNTRKPEEVFPTWPPPEKRSLSAVFLISCDLLSLHRRNSCPRNRA
jgi:hypothetical protein